MKPLSGRQRMGTLLAGGVVWWVAAPWLGRDGRRESQQCWEVGISVPTAAAGSQRDWKEDDAVPDPARVADKCKGGGMSSCLGKDPGEGACLCTLNLEVISSESRMSYCNCPSGLFLSRGREVLSFVCTMFITQFPFWLMPCSMLSCPPPSGFYCSFKWGQFGCLAEQAGSVWHQLPFPASKPSKLPVQF